MTNKALLALMLTFLASRAIAQDFVVLATVHPTYAIKVGDLLSKNDLLDFPDNSSARLVRSDDTIIDVTGPFRGTLPASNNDLVGRLFDQIKSVLAAVQAFGLIRSDVASLADDPFVFDLSTGGHKCFIPNETPKLWMTARPRPHNFELRLRTGHSVGYVRFEAGETMQSWPPSLPLRDGEEIIVSDPDPENLNADSLSWIPVSIPGKRDKDKELASKMIRLGCVNQALIITHATNADINVQTAPQR